MGQFLVGLTGLESAGRVVVSHGEGDGVMLEGCTENEAKVGYVAAYPYAEVISGYTAFFLGVRAACPSAVMDVKYTYTWKSVIEIPNSKSLELCLVI